MPVCYIPFSEKINTYYIGSTNDIERRLYEPHHGLTKFTSTGIPWLVVYIEEIETSFEASRGEHYIKNKKLMKYIESLILIQNLI
jgi:putative endonuclease